MVSVIIPTYNEEKALPVTLRHLLSQPGDYEVLVVDGGSTDRTCLIAQTESRVRLLEAPKGRALQMNAGAKRATGTWLLFLHADTRLPDGALLRLNAMEADAAAQAGGFWHRFSGENWRLRLVSCLDNFRCRFSRIIYGDQALFVRRFLFERLGGFPDRPILEDVAFCEKLVHVTVPILLSPSVITDSRKFVAVGVWRSLARALLIILHVEFRVPILPKSFFNDIR
jgi:rSAM/selenodomain-associated transferase 2